MWTEVDELHNDEHHIWFSSCYLRWWGMCHVQERSTFKILFSKHEGKRSVGKPWHRWENNIKMNVKSISGKLWTGFIYFRIVTIGRLL
jgi:hypothetical protein